MKRSILGVSDGVYSGTGFSEESRQVLFRLSQDKDFDVSGSHYSIVVFPRHYPTRSSPTYRIGTAR